jgi:hypothetical protein
MASTGGAGSGRLEVCFDVESSEWGSAVVAALTRTYHELQERHRAGQAEYAGFGAVPYGGDGAPGASVASVAESEQQPADPWYARDRFHALGDIEVAGITVARDPAADADAAVLLLKKATEGAATQDGPRISRNLGKKLTSELVKALGSSDPVEWENRLHTGLMAGDGETVVRAWFSLMRRTASAGEATAQPGGAAAQDSVLSSYRSKYGDVTYEKTANKTQSSSIGTGTEVLHGGAGAAMFFGPSLDIAFSASRTEGRTFADEVQAGSRPIVGGKAVGGYTVRIDLLAVSRSVPEGVQAHRDVDGMVVTAAHPEPLTRDDLASKPLVIPVRNPAAVEAFKTTFGAIDSRPLERAFLAALLSSRAVSAEKAAEIATDAVRESIGEKPLRDRARYLPGGLPTNFATAKGTIGLTGFNGYVRMESAAVSVQPIGDVQGDNRDDIAETVTVVGATGHGSGFGLKAGLVTGLPHAVTVTGHPISVGTESHHITRSSVQAQPKTAILDGGGNLRRFKAVVRISGEIHADRNITYDLRDDEIGLSAPVSSFSADLDAELLVPGHYADEFERKIQENPEAVTKDRRYPLPRPTGRAAGHRGPARRKVKGPALFPARGLHSTSELIDYLTRTASADDPVALRMPAGHLDAPAAAGPWAVAPEQRDQLLRLQEAGQLRLFEVTKDGHTHRLAGSVAGTSTTGITAMVTREAVEKDAVPQALGRRGYALDESGVTYGWDDVHAEPNPGNGREGSGAGRREGEPAGTPAPAAETPIPAAGRPVPAAERTLATLVAQAAKGDDTIAVVTGPREDLLPGHEALAGADQGVVVWRVNGRSLPGDLLAYRDLPSTGYVMGPAGRAVWGWRPAGFDALAGSGELTGSGTLTGREGTAGAAARLESLVREAERTGLQLVVNPDTAFAGKLREAAMTAPRRPVEERKDTLGALVTSPQVRIVDEHGIVQNDLHANPVPAAAELGQEYAVHADGRISKSVTWREDGRAIPHVRRARYQADPYRETPELAAGVGFGSAALMEIPGAERVQREIRSTIVNMVNNDYAEGARKAGGKRARHEKLPAYQRFALDKQLQIAFSAPRLRAARGRAADGALRETFRVGGRKYVVSVTQALGRRDANVGSRPNISVDHQAKGTRAGTGVVSKSWSAGADFGVAARAGSAKHAVAADLGEFTLDARYARQKVTSWGSQAKHYSRMRSPGGDAFVPDYLVRYQFTVTEIRGRVRSTQLGASATATRLARGPRTTRGGVNRRVVSRIISGDNVRVPAIVHSAFRPPEPYGDADAARHYRAAFDHVVSTIGRTTELAETDAGLAKLREMRLNFARTGTVGAHAFFAGLRESVVRAHELVLRHAEEDGQYARYDRRLGRSPVPGDDFFLLAPEIEKVLSEAFLRANLQRLLGPHGIPVPLPKEYHDDWHRDARDLVRPHVNRSLTVRGFLVDADEDAGHWAPKAANESYAEWDSKLDGQRENTVRVTVSGSAGPVIRVGPGPDGTGSGGEGVASSRRAVENRVGVSVDGNLGLNVYSKTKSEAAGSIDVSLLSEKSGMHVRRAHLVLELTSTRQAGGQYSLRGKAQRTLLGEPLNASTKKSSLLVENAAELSLSKTLDDDLDDFSRLSPHPLPERHVTRTDAAYSASFVTHFDDTGALFVGTTADGDFIEPKPDEPGITGAIRTALRTARLVGAEHLNDTSDTWRAITAKYDPAELQSHVDDLRGTGVVHRAEVPVVGGRTRQVTIVATARPRRLRWVRTRDGGSVTFGGQSLRQEGEQTNRHVDAGVSASAYGIYTKDNFGYGRLGGTVGAGAGKSASFGHETVNRHIIRTTARATGPAAGGTEKGKGTAAGSDGDPAASHEPQHGEQQPQRGEGDGEEFADSLDIDIKIYSSTLLPEPLPRLQRASADGKQPKPDVILTVRRDAPVRVRLVVPRQLTEPGQPLSEITSSWGTTPAAGPEPHVAFSANHPAPGALEHDLGEKLIALSFPDLDTVTTWAPTATLSRDSARDAVHRSRPQAGGKYAPTADRGYHLLTSLTNRHVRDNAGNLFDQKLSLSPPGDRELIAGVRIRGVLRPVGKPAPYNGLNFTERADEPTYAQSSARTKFATVVPGGGTQDGSGAPTVLNPSPRSEHESVAYIGDYTEYNRKFDNLLLHSYQANAVYDIIGADGYAVHVHSSRPLEGLLVDAWARELADKYPSMVVHPDAMELPADAVARSNVIAGIVDRIESGTLSAPAEGAPMRLFADPGNPAAEAAYLDAARDLGVRLADKGYGGPVDLAIIRREPDGTSILEHHEKVVPSFRAVLDEAELQALGHLLAGWREANGDGPVADPALQRIRELARGVADGFQPALSIRNGRTNMTFTLVSTSPHHVAALQLAQAVATEVNHPVKLHVIDVGTIDLCP